MLLRQKEELIRLIQMYFVRKLGGWTNVSEKDLDSEVWMEFATKLNQLGPPKDAESWKTVSHDCQTFTEKGNNLDFLSRSII